MDHSVFHLYTPKVLILESWAAGGFAKGDDFMSVMLRNVCQLTLRRSQFCESGKCHCQIYA